MAQKNLVSNLFQLFERRWLRRLYMIFLGLLLGFYYFFLKVDDMFLTPFLVAFLVGLFSYSALVATVNTLIVLFSMIATVLVASLAQYFGAGESINWEAIFWLLSQAFLLALIPLITWMPGLFAGYFTRYLVGVSSFKDKRSSIEN